MFLFLGGRGRGRGRARASTDESFSQDDARFQTAPFFYVIYYILSSGGFTAACFMPSRKVPSTSMPLGSARVLFRLRQPVDLVYASIYVKGLLLHVPPPRSCGYVAYAYAFYVVMCYMSITCISQLYVLKCYMSLNVMCLLFV